MPLFFYHTLGGRCPVQDYFAKVPGRHCLKAIETLQRIGEQGLEIPFPNLKILKQKVWRYQGTIYKLRVDANRVSSRILFCYGAKGEIVLLHAFHKKTAKTPPRDAHLAMKYYAHFLRDTSCITPVLIS
jgi:phage-related protein